MDTFGNPVYNLAEYKAGKRRPKEEVVVGEEVVVMTFFGYTAATVTEKNFAGEYVAENEHSVFPLSFNKDKGCWVCSTGVNKAAIRRLRNVEE